MDKKVLALVSVLFLLVIAVSNSGATVVMSLPDGGQVYTKYALSPYYCDKSTLFQRVGEGVFIENGDNTYSIIQCNNGTVEYGWDKQIVERRECTGFETATGRILCGSISVEHYRSTDGQNWNLWSAE